MNSDQALDVSKESPFSCLERPSSLQILAASKIAFRLWLNKYQVQDGDESGCWMATWPRSLSVFSCRHMLAVPASVRDMIDKYIFIVGKELKMWEDNLRTAVKQHDEKLVEIFARGFDGIVCKLSGEICFQSSARKILMIEGLDVLTMFKIACQFCLEDEIKKIWPSVSKMLPKFGNTPLVRYWKNTLDNFVSSERVVAEQLANAVQQQNWAAFEYFWGMLTEERQTLQAIVFLNTYDFNTSRRVLLKLNEKQAREVCEQCADKIFTQLISNEEFSSYAIPLWTCVKNLIPGPVFLKILRPLWRMVFNPKESELTMVKLNSDLVRKLWSSASDSLKSAIPQSELFAELDSNIRDINCYDSTFMFEVLENASHESKKEIWANNWYKILIRVSVSDLKKLIELCSVDDDEIDLSKESNSSKLEELRDYFNTLVNKGLYSELCEFLGFFVRDLNRLETLSKEIIFTNLHHISVYDDEELAKLSSFIYFTFNNTSANKFIEQFISSPECLVWIHSKLDDHCYDDVMNLCLRFPSPDEDMQNVKRALLIYCYGNFSSGQIIGFDAQKFTEFSYWCCEGGENMVADLKRSINIDDIFETVLNNLMREIIASRTFNRLVLSKLDEFLVWFFVNLETARTYKSAKILVYRNYESVKFALKDGVIAERVHSLLNWGMGVENDEAGPSSKRRRV